MVFNRVANCCKNRRKIKSSGSMVSISFSNSKLSMNDSGEETSFKIRFAPLRMTGSKYRSHNLHRTLRQRTHEGPSVWFRHDSIVENHDNAAITFDANKAADSLTQFQDRFRQRVFREGVATARFDIFEFRLD